MIVGRVKIDSMQYKKETEELNKVPIQTVASLLGLSLPLAKSVSCPLPGHDDKNPSFQIHKSGTRWNCFGCGRHGGSIDFVKEYNGINFREAKNWLAKQSGIDTKQFRQLRPARELATLATHNINQTPETLPDSDVYEYLLNICPLQNDGQQYLVGRAISANTQKDFRIGQLHSASMVIRLLLTTFGFARIYRAGLLTKNSKQTNARLVFTENCLIFPFVENRRITYLQGRVLGKIDQLGKWRNLSQRRKRIYNIDALAQSSSKKLAICEGTVDTLSAIELNYIAVGFLGVNTKLTIDQMKLLRGKEVDILLDWDKAGEKRAKCLQTELNQFGVVSTRKSKPSTSAKDLNEYLMETKGLV